jgi:hypothetical protein
VAPGSPVDQGAPPGGLRPSPATSAACWCYRGDQAVQEEPARERITAHCSLRPAVIPRQVPGTVNSPAAGQGGHRAHMMISSQFGGGSKGLPDGLLSGAQQLVHLLVVSEMLASIRRAGQGCAGTTMATGRSWLLRQPGGRRVLLGTLRSSARSTRSWPASPRAAAVLTLPWSLWPGPSRTEQAPGVGGESTGGRLTRPAA